MDLHGCTGGEFAASATAAASTAPPTTEPPTPPIAVEEFTRLDADTAVRGSFTDTVTATINIAHEGMTR